MSPDGKKKKSVNKGIKKRILDDRSDIWGLELRRNKGLIAQFGTHAPPNNRKSASLLDFYCFLILPLSLNSTFPSPQPPPLKMAPQVYLDVKDDFSRYPIGISSNPHDSSDSTSPKMPSA